MFKGVKRFLIGRPLKNEALGGEKFGIAWGLPILASDAISSVAYAGEAVLTTLLPLIGILAYGQLTVISIAIICLLGILMLSYRQTIDKYPNGGGAYIVAKDNLGVIAGVTAGAALSVDYVLTVAVSVSSGVQQIASAFTPIKPYIVPVCVVIVLILMVGNLRGIRESSRAFGIPTYAFIIAIISMLVAGFLKLKNGYIPPEPAINSLGEPVGIFLILKAFSSGCTALTGVEAVSNAVPNFKEPSTKYAKTVLLLLSIVILILFGGTSILANLYHVVPIKKTMLVLMAEEIFGRGPMFYYVTVTAFTILVLAANTAYSGFPMLIAVMAKERYVPKQLSMRGDRLSYSNGINVLSIISILLIIAFNARVESLLGLYAIGVFISFTLSQTGMFMRWIRTKERHWGLKAVINGFGAVVTAVVVVVIAIAKAHEGSLAPNMDQSKKFLDMTDKYTQKIMIAENYRYNEENSKILEIIKSGRIGDVVYFIRNNVSCFPCEMSKDTFAAKEWRQHPVFPGGSFLDGAVHDIAGMRHIFGSVVCVQAFGKPQQEDYNPYMSINTNIQFKSGIIGQFNYFPSGLEPQKPLVGFRIFGTKGEIYLEEKSCGIINVAYNDGGHEHVTYTPERGYYNELLNYYNSLNGTEEIYVTPEVEFGDVKMIFDILDSISKTKLVYVDETDRRNYVNYTEGNQQTNAFLQ